MITKLILTDRGPFEHFEADLAKITVITGENGLGKSVILSNLAAFFEPGNAFEQVRTGCEKGTVEIELDSGERFLRWDTARSYSLQGWNSDTTKMKSEAETRARLRSLASGLGFDPIQFIKDKKDRCDILAKVMPLSFSVRELEAIVATEDLPEHDLDLSGLHALAEKLYVRRSDRNAAAKAAEGAIKQLGEALPEDDGRDWPSEEKTARQQIENLECALRTELEAIAEDLRSAIDNIQTAAEAEVKRIRDAAEAQKQVARETAEKARAEAEALARPMIDDRRAAVATARAKSDESQRVKALQERRLQERANLRANTLSSQDLTNRLDRLDKLEKAKLSSLPIPGLGVVGGRVIYDGKDFDTQLNTAEQIKLAFAIGAMFPASLMICDGMEALGEENTDIVIEAARSMDPPRQVVLARVERGQKTLCVTGA